tara:strand:- start:954 stop:1574 length:621 start_codon:yes stop_codon:yes gene_type:complete
MHHLEQAINTMKVVFLDRDGVINRDTGYVHQWQNFEYIEGALEGMRILNKNGFEIVIITNQSGIARGLYTENDFAQLSQKMLRHLQENGIKILNLFYCPHHPSGIVKKYTCECDCRKPQPGMLIRAAEVHGIELKKSILIGDKPSDIIAARNAGVHYAYHVQSENKESNVTIKEADRSFPSLLDCASWIEKNNPLTLPPTATPNSK